MTVETLYYTFFTADSKEIPSCKATIDAEMIIEVGFYSDVDIILSNIDITVLKVVNDQWVTFDGIIFNGPFQLEAGESYLVKSAKFRIEEIGTYGLTKPLYHT